ncbi:MAG: hypothetical protein ACW97P_13025 [Candidatus Hodarchaeales archaeon]|jgi:hypothetical protein
MEKYKENIEISDNELLDSFIETNCYIRLAVMKTLAYNWDDQNEKKRFSLAVAFFEQFLSFLEGIEMLLFAMIDKGKCFDKPLFYYYKKTYIKESLELNNKSIVQLKQTFALVESNNDFCNIFGLDIKKLSIESDGKELKAGLSALLDYLDIFRLKLPLVKAYNASKHGMLVLKNTLKNELYIRFIIDMEPIDNKNSNATYTASTINSKLLHKLIRDTEILSETFRGFFLMIEKGYE